LRLSAAFQIHPNALSLEDRGIILNANPGSDILGNFYFSFNT
jgi:hypothetical protein